MTHHDLIRVIAVNKLDAQKKVKEFLECYNKKKIFIGAVEGSNNFYEVEVQYTDNYKDCSVFNSVDFIPSDNVNKLSLKYKY